MRKKFKMFSTIEQKLSGRGRNCWLGHGEHNRRSLVWKTERRKSRIFTDDLCLLFYLFLFYTRSNSTLYPFRSNKIPQSRALSFRLGIAVLIPQSLACVLQYIKTFTGLTFLIPLSGAFPPFARARAQFYKSYLFLIFSYVLCTFLQA